MDSGVTRDEIKGLINQLEALYERKVQERYLALSSEIALKFHLRMLQSIRDEVARISWDVKK